jgi:dihydroflavonol-4-reductase
MRLLITGASGFVGRAVATAALAHGHEVRAVVRDRTRAAGLAEAGADVTVGSITDIAAVTSALEGVDVLVQSAAVYDYRRGEGERMIRENPAITDAVLEAAGRAGTRHVIDISSAVVFKPHQEGARAGVVDTESPRWLPGDVHWDDPYLRSKVLSDRVADRHRADGLPISSVYPSMVIGPGDRGPGTSGALLASLPSRRVQLDGALGWTDIRDVAAAVLAVAARAPGGRHIVSIGTRSLREMAALADMAIGRRMHRLFVPRPAARAMARVNDAFRGRLVPDLPPRPSLEYLLTTGPIDGSSGLPALGLRHRPLEETVRDAFDWWAANGTAP